MLRRVVRLALPALVLCFGAHVAVAQSNGKGGKSGHTNPGKTDNGTKKSAEKVTLVFFGNEKCPCGKPADHDLFVEEDGQRIYVCSEACKATVAKDAKAALAKVYSNVTPVSAKACATCGKALDAAAEKDATFQGRKVELCCDKCVAQFKKDPVLFLTKLTWPDAKDAKNPHDPVSGKPVSNGVVAIYRNHLIHFASAKSIAAFEKDPEAAVAKLKLH
jgi:YHS domain-containing protein